MTLYLFLRESAGSHSLHRPGWAVVEARPDSAQYHAAKTRVKLFVNFTLKLRPARGATAPGARGKTDIDLCLTAPTGPHRRALWRSFEPVSRLEGWLMSPRLHRSRKGRTYAFAKSCWS